MDIKVGNTVCIRRGLYNEGYRFRVVEITPAPPYGEAQVYGHNYGPVRLSDVTLCS